MKILIDARPLGARPSGIGMYIYHFAKGLAAYAHIEPALATDVKESAELRELEERYRIPVYPYGRKVSKGPAVWRYCRYLQSLIHQIKPDIFWEANNLLPVSIKNPYGKYAVTIHDVFPITMPEQYGQIYPRYFQYGIRKTIAGCDGILYNSVNSMKQTEALFPQAKVKRPFQSYIAVPPIPAMDRQRKDYFFYVGNLERRKGMDLLLNAYSQYRKAGGTRELYLAGNIRGKDIRDQIERAEQETGSVHYLGYLSKAERDVRYQECGCFLFPSRAEGFGIPVIEALSCGTDVIASDLPVFRELAGNAVAYFEPHAVYEQAAENLAQAMLHFKAAGAAQRTAYQKAAERYAPEALLPGLAAYFERLVSEET